MPARTAQAYATMALAEYQLGQTNAARTALAQGLKIPESELANPGRLDWNDAIIAHSLLREAQSEVEDARLEALLIEGLSGGGDVAMTREFWKDLKAEARGIAQKHKTRKRA